MPRKCAESENRSIQLLEKLVLLQLHALSVPQGKIARFLGKQTAWVNTSLKGIPKPKKEKGRKK